MDDVCLTSHSPAFLKNLEYCRKVAASNVNVMLIGESGTGKEVAARYIHALSPRATKPFVAVNCSAYPESLLESELFGHEVGAFTGAVKDKRGMIEMAQGGSLFLDEIGETRPTTQIKLLRVLETKQVERVGSNRPRQIDFRLISATNADMHEVVSNRAFREDFFYRISSIVIRIPPLRERREDLPILIDFFMRKLQQETGLKIRAMVPEVERFLEEYSYPGNVRELKNIIERFVTLSENGVITKDCLPVLHSVGLKPEQTETNVILPLKQWRACEEKAYLERVLSVTQGNVTQAARLLELTPRHLFNKLKEYQIER